ncbi:MAG: 4Fe-4S dicluster domain-containing protein [Chloroflexi bacterium]|nr:4Fe-4S dicluster domain-containing protein [Chloroflexota bacterium]MDA8187968.1 4Fe-4S dicluster domain-containing protein [Dehalococcoidales bacterium]
MEKVLVADYQKCTGCRTCEMACSLAHVRECNPAKSAVQIVKWEAEGLDVPIICQQCAEPACAGICPVRAINRDAATGALTIDYDTCIGCRMCLIACPFGALAYDVDRRRPIKCDLCNGDPKCVQFCEPRALTYSLPTEVEYARKRLAGRRLAEVTARSTSLP